MSTGARKAALASAVIFGIWLILTGAAYACQDQIMTLLYSSEISETTEAVLPWSVYVHFILGIVVFMSCLQIWKGKKGLAPLIFTAIPTLIIPVLAGIAGFMQNIYVSRIMGVNSLVRYSVAGNVANVLYYLFNAACVIATAAAAVTYYAGRHNENEEENY